MVPLPVMDDGTGPMQDEAFDEHRPQPEHLRPDGRAARVRAAVLRATGEALTEHGFTQLDLADVAARAGVGRTTVHRRWGTASGLVAELLVDLTEQSPPRTDTGSLLGDLTQNARLVARTLADPRQGPLLRAVIVAAASDDDTAESLHRFYETRIAEWAGCVDDAVARGEVPPGTNAHEVIRLVSAPLYRHFLTTAEPPDESAADRAAEAAVAAARAGVYLGITATDR